MKYIKKPIVVEAVQFRESFADIVKAFGDQGCFIYDPTCGFYIDIPEGLMMVSPGDYVIKGVNGEFYPCKPDVFQKTYDLFSQNSQGSQASPDSQNFTIYADFMKNAQN